VIPTIGRLLKISVLVAALAAGAVTALAADVSGTWNVDGNVYGNPVKYACTLKQDGDKLTGTARIQEKDVPVTGTIQEKAVMWRFDVEYNGAPLEMVFNGTLASDTDIKGTIAVAGVEGEFTAKRE
jgi:hypothetical protein